MEIRKLFKIEAAQHIVRNCTSERCSHSVHNHGAIVEIFFTADHLDNAQMILDFGLTKKSIKDFVDSFDHCMVFWDKDNPEYIQDMKKWCDRWIELPINPTAEMLAIYFCYMINKILYNTKFNNGEGNVTCSRVIYHETSTGCAIATPDDVRFLSELQPKHIGEFSEGVVQDWSKELKEFIHDLNRNDLYKSAYFINPIVEQQVK